MILEYIIPADQKKEYIIPRPPLSLYLKKKVLHFTKSDYLLYHDTWTDFPRNIRGWIWNIDFFCIYFPPTID